MLVCFLQGSNEFSLVCDYKPMMIFIMLYFLWFATIRSQWFILTCSNFFFTYANVKHFQVFNFVGCCQSAFLLQCVKATICFMCCLEIKTIFVFSICAIIKTWFSYLVPMCYYLFLCSFFIFHVFFLQKFVICSNVLPFFLYL